MERRESLESAEDPGSIPEADSTEDPSRVSYLFDDLSIDCPTEEFRRVYEKKMRSFESDHGSGIPDSYRKAYELGVELIRRHLGVDETDAEEARASVDPGEGEAPC